jgi:F-type H+-transporting ATPase subunit epsilon
MAETFLLEIVTPRRKLLSKEVDMLSAPSVQGEIGVLPGHIELLTLLGPGLLTYSSGGDTGLIAIGRGYAEVTREKATVLVEEAEFADEIDVDAAKKEFKDAEEAMIGLDFDDPVYKEAEYARAIAEAKLKAKGLEV